MYQSSSRDFARSPTVRQRKEMARIQLHKRIVDFIGGTITCALFGLFFAYLMVNWVSGCGERFPTADGGYIQGECISVSQMFGE